MNIILSINIAINSISDASSTNKYTIIIHPGTYYEENIVMKEFVDIIDINNENCIIKFTTTSTTIIGNSNSSIKNVCIIGNENVTILISVNSSNNFTADNIILNSINSLITLNNNASLILKNSTFITNNFTQNTIGINIQDNSILKIYNCLTINSTTSLKRFINVTHNAKLTTFDSNFEIISNLGDCICIYVKDAAVIEILNTIISKFKIGIYNEQNDPSYGETSFNILEYRLKNVVLII